MKSANSKKISNYGKIKANHQGQKAREFLLSAPDLCPTTPLPNPNAKATHPNPNPNPKVTPHQAKPSQAKTEKRLNAAGFGYENKIRERMGTDNELADDISTGNG